MAEHFEELLTSGLGEGDGTVGEAWAKSLLAKAMIDPKLGMRLLEALSRVPPNTSSGAADDADDLSDDEQLILEAEVRKIAELSEADGGDG